MNNLMVFEGNNVEVFEFEGQVLFNPRDVGKCLDIKDIKSSIRNFNKNQKKKITNKDLEVHSLHFRKLNNAGETFLTEAGVYKLIFKSHKEEAERFQDWVTDEVLPTIRQTGGYIPVKESDSDEEILARALLIAQKTLEKKDKLISEMTPKASWFDKFINSDGLYTSTQVAKLFGYKSAQDLNKKLNEMKIIYKQNKSWVPYSNVDTTWFKLLVGAKNEHNYSSLKFTPKGIVEISNRLNINLNEEDLKEFS